jgi:C4-dicarboxylate transporter, DctM subunit
VNSVGAGITGLVVLFLLLAARMPIGFAMALVGFVGASAIIGIDGALSMIGMVPYSEVASYTLSVVPLFLLMGQFAFNSGLSADAYYSAHRWLGHLPGGVAMATIGGCAGFAAVSGSSLAGAATMGMVALPEMRRYKYDMSLATGSIAAGGTLGILIPPSISMVIYGLLTEQSIGKLLIAGIFPGILLTLLFMLTIYVLTRRNPALGPPARKASLTQRLVALKGGWGILVIFAVVMGGMYGGICTATEAAAIGALGCFLFMVGRKRVTRKDFLTGLEDTGRIVGMIFAILIGATIFSNFLALSRLPVELANWIGALPVHRYGILAIILFLYFIMGCLMDILAMVVLTIPIFFPVITHLGFDPIWFGVIIVIMMEQGLITPPIGMNVFVLHGIAKDVPMYTIFRGILPFLVAMWICLLIVIIFPQIALYLPNAMRGR